MAGQNYGKLFHKEFARAAAILTDSITNEHE